MCTRLIFLGAMRLRDSGKLTKTFFDKKNTAKMPKGRRAKINSDLNEDRLVSFFRTAAPDEAAEGYVGGCVKKE